MVEDVCRQPEDSTKAGCKRFSSFVKVQKTGVTLFNMRTDLRSASFAHCGIKGASTDNFAIALEFVLFTCYH